MNIMASIDNNSIQECKEKTQDWMLATTSDWWLKYMIIEKISVSMQDTK